jgi:hypothetical protein
MWITPLYSTSMLNGKSLKGVFNANISLGLSLLGLLIVILGGLFITP